MEAVGKGLLRASSARTAAKVGVSCSLFWPRRLDRFGKRRTGTFRVRVAANHMGRAKMAEKVKLTGEGRDWEKGRFMEKDVIDEWGQA